MTTPPLVSFHTTVVAAGNNTGIEVPPDLIEKLEAGKRPAVVVGLNGFSYQNTVGVMGGKHFISVSAAVRKATGLAGGDWVDVTLRLAAEPRRVELHDESGWRSKATRKQVHSSLDCPTACSATTPTA